MELTEKGYFQQIALFTTKIRKEPDFPAIFTRLDDPEVFRWMKSVTFGTTVPRDCGTNTKFDESDDYYDY